MINKFENVLKLIAEKEYEKADENLGEMLNISSDKEEKEKIKTYRTFIANKLIKETGFRADVFFYLTGALNYYNDKTTEQIKKVSFEIGIKAEEGFEINNPKAEVEIKALGKTMSHLQAICYMYAGFKTFEPTMNIGVDFKEEWEEAVRFK